MDRVFTKSGDSILLTGIARNPNFFCKISIPALFAGEIEFPCSFPGVSYRLMQEEVKIAKLVASEKMEPVEQALRMSAQNNHNLEE